MSFPPVTEMFQFTGFASPTYEFSRRSPTRGGVSPFGNLWIKGCSPLPIAYRSVLRPSSPLSAKASTRCPYYAYRHRTLRPVTLQQFRHTQGQALLRQPCKLPRTLPLPTDTVCRS
jgi:hypothetical protein